ncbi:MAG: flagellar type III secretion system pore protein FliP [Syntrophomonadaceae bacterium]|jgi:flagellar biosynthetic protein FliP|nr:flagellar type III secretion system pore protein FliP [Syntrophomonadaceae bacterium]
METVFSRTVKRSSKYRWGLAIIIGAAFLGMMAETAVAATNMFNLPDVNLQVGDGSGEQGPSGAIQLLVLLTALTLAPAVVITLTSFTRIIVVLSFVRSSLATQQMPPNQVLIGLALFLTFFIMAPTFQQINTQTVQPYINGEISNETAFTQGMEPLRNFMLGQTREKDLALFVRLSGLERPNDFADIPNYVLIPSFIISELKTAFQIGFIIFIPFLIIDMVVASALMSMGMMMLPPMMISLPFKILLFVLVDGWNLIVSSLMMTFR